METDIGPIEYYVLMQLEYAKFFFFTMILLTILVTFNLSYVSCVMKYLVNCIYFVSVFY